MSKFLLLLAVVAGLILTNSVATAGGNANPFNVPGNNSLFRIFKKTPLPAFQAAPWYTYFPYNGHFQTPAPMPGQDVPGPMGYGYGAGNGWMNPYFPTQQGPGK
jgi:hypothetical protein